MKELEWTVWAVVHKWGCLISRRVKTRICTTLGSRKGCGAKFLEVQSMPNEYENSGTLQWKVYIYLMEETFGKREPLTTFEGGIVTPQVKQRRELMLVGLPNREWFCS